MTTQATRPSPVAAPVAAPLAAAKPPLADRALARRVREVPPSGIRRFFDIAATMTDVISLGIGEPDFDTPEQVVEAGVRSLRAGRTHYTSNYGTLELRRALAEHLDAPLRRRLRPGDRDPRHGRRVRGPGPRDARDDRPRRRGRPPRALVRRLLAGCHVLRRRRELGLDTPRRRLRARPGGARGGDHAAHEGPVPGLPVQPDGRGPAAPTSSTSSRGSPSATICWSSPTRSTTGSRTATTVTARSAPCPGCASGRSCSAASRRRTR